MLALKITSIKEFMNALFAGETFDSFLLEECAIKTSIYYEVDGHINMDFYPMDERTTELHPYSFVEWKEFRSKAFDMIKGKNAPLFFRIVLILKPDVAENMLKKAEPDGDYSTLKALLINIKYDENGAVITTGTSYNTFTMDKTPDRLWDTALEKFLSGKGIGFEEL